MLAAGAAVPVPLAGDTELVLVAAPMVCACKPKLGDKISAASTARRQSDLENNFNMDGWENEIKIKPARQQARSCHRIDGHAH